MEPSALATAHLVLTGEAVLDALSATGVSFGGSASDMAVPVARWCAHRGEDREHAFAALRFVLGEALPCVVDDEAVWLGRCVVGLPFELVGRHLRVHARHLLRLDPGAPRRWATAAAAGVQRGDWEREIRRAIAAVRGERTVGIGLARRQRLRTAQLVVLADCSPSEARAVVLVRGGGSARQLRARLTRLRAKD